VKLLDRLVLRQFFTGFFALVMGLPLLFVVVDLTENLDSYLGRGLSGGEVVLSYAYMIPQFIHWGMPIAALIATVFTISGMTRHNEIAAAKAGGISFYRLTAPLLTAGVLLTGAGLALSEVVPVTNRLRAEVLGERTGRQVVMKTNFVYQSAGGLSLSIRRLDAAHGEISGVLLQQEGRRGERLHGTAARGVWEGADGWVLQDGWVRLLGGEGEETTFAFEAMRIPSLRDTPEELLADPKDPDEMRYGEINHAVAAVRRAGGDARELLVNREQRLALPVAVLVIILFGAPLATSSKRGGTAFGVGLSLAVTMVYLMLFRVGEAVGTSGAIDPLVAAWGPNALFLAAGLLMMARVRS
jgi:lipopolysaccharide export system permease protein